MEQEAGADNPSKQPPVPPVVPSGEPIASDTAQEEQAAAGSDPDAEMEELGPGKLSPILARLPDEKAEDKASSRIYESERRRYCDEDLTPAEENELKDLARLHPEAAEKMRKKVERRHYGTKLGREYAGRLGRDPSRSD